MYRNSERVCYAGSQRKIICRRIFFWSQRKTMLRIGRRGDTSPHVGLAYADAAFAYANVFTARAAFALAC